jgi:long-chain fatty acid transport protein
MIVPISSVHASNVGDTYGFSTYGLSLGNAMCARADDWDSVYYNIAGLGKAVGKEEKTSQLGVVYMGNSPMFNIDITRTKDGVPIATKGDEDLGGGSIIAGGVFDIKPMVPGLLLPYVSSLRGGAGLIFNSDQTLVKINDIDPRTHEFMRYGRDCQRISVMAGVGIGLFNDMLGFGMGVNSSLSGEGVILLENVDLQTEPQSPLGQAKMDMSLDQNLIMGMYYTPVDMLEFGLSYKAETALNIYPFKTAAETELGGIPLNLMLALNDYYSPEMITAGMAITTKKFTVSLDLEYQKWSGFEMSATKELNFGDERVDFDDIFIPRVGLQYLLFGYFYQPSFVPDEAIAGDMNYLDSDKHVLSTGVAVKFPELFGMKSTVELIAGYQLQYLVDRDVIKTNPTPENPNYTFGGTAHTVSIGCNINL